MFSMREPDACCDHDRDEHGSESSVSFRDRAMEAAGARCVPLHSALLNGGRIGPCSGASSHEGTARPSRSLGRPRRVALRPSLLDEKWHVLGAGLFHGKIRAVVSTLGPRSKGVKTDKVILQPGQMKLFYVVEGKVALRYNGESHILEAGDSAYLDGGTPHGWENVGHKVAKVLWVILG